MSKTIQLQKAANSVELAPNIYLTLYDLHGKEEKDIEAWVDHHPTLECEECLDQYGILFVREGSKDIKNSTPFLWHISSLYASNQFAHLHPAHFTRGIVSLIEKYLQSSYSHTTVILFHPTKPESPIHLVDYNAFGYDIPTTYAPTKREASKSEKDFVANPNLITTLSGIVKASSSTSSVLAKEADGYFELLYQLQSINKIPVRSYFKLVSGTFGDMEGLIEGFKEYVKRTMMCEIIDIGPLFLRTSKPGVFTEYRPIPTPSADEGFIKRKGLMTVDAWRDLYRKSPHRSAPKDEAHLPQALAHAQVSIFKTRFSENEKEVLGFHPETEHLLIIKVASGWIATYLDEDENYVIYEYNKDFPATILDEAHKLIQEKL